VSGINKAAWDPEQPQTIRITQERVVGEIAYDPHGGDAQNVMEAFASAAMKDAVEWMRSGERSESTYKMVGPYGDANEITIVNAPKQPEAPMTVAEAKAALQRARDAEAGRGEFAPVEGF
jgi:hypothetical protein